MFATASTMPTLDQSQDYKILGGTQNDSHTTVRFWRAWDTCDQNEGNDRAITKDTVRLIWAYHEKDTVDGAPKYHFENRGVKSIHLMEPARDKLPMEAGIKTWDVRAYGQQIPGERDTYYGCQIMKVPFIKKKHHMIGVSKCPKIVLE